MTRNPKRPTRGTGMPKLSADIADLAAHLRRTLAKPAKVPIPSSMRQQLPKMLSHYLHHRRRGETFVYPGMDKMATWSECSVRTARTNFGRLEVYGVVQVVAYGNGGRRSARFVMHIPALWLFLVSAGLNPSQALREKLDAADPDRRNPEVERPENPEVSTDENPEENPEETSAGIQSDIQPNASGTVAGDALQPPDLPSTDATGGEDEQATTKAAPPAPQTEPAET